MVESDRTAQLKEMEERKFDDEILQGLRGLKRAEASSFLFTRIQSSLDRQAREKTVSTFSVLSLSIAFTVLIAVNVWAITVSNKGKGRQEIQSGYAPDNANFNIYQP